MALGDASLFAPDRLPATAQVAGQQGAYAAHLINRGFSLGRGGMDQVRWWGCEMRQLGLCPLLQLSAWLASPCCRFPAAPRTRCRPAATAQQGQA